MSEQGNRGAERWSNLPKMTQQIAELWLECRPAAVPGQDPKPSCSWDTDSPAVLPGAASYSSPTPSCTLGIKVDRIQMAQAGLMRCEGYSSRGAQSGWERIPDSHPLPTWDVKSKCCSHALKTAMTTKHHYDWTLQFQSICSLDEGDPMPPGYGMGLSCVGTRHTQSEPPISHPQRPHSQRNLQAHLSWILLAVSSKAVRKHLSRHWVSPRIFHFHLKK